MDKSANKSISGITKDVLLKITNMTDELESIKEQLNNILKIHHKQKKDGEEFMKEWKI